MDELIDWLIDKNRSGYQMVNSVPCLQEMKAFMRMFSCPDMRYVGWSGNGNGAGEKENEPLAKNLFNCPTFHPP